MKTAEQLLKEVVRLRRHIRKLERDEQTRREREHKASELQSSLVRALRLQVGEQVFKSLADQNLATQRPGTEAPFKGPKGKSRAQVLLEAQDALIQALRQHVTEEVYQGLVKESV